MSNEIGYIFDCDGVSCDTERVYFNALGDTFSELLKTNLTENKYVEEYCGNDSRENLDQIKNKFELSESSALRFRDYYEKRVQDIFENIERIPLMHGAKEAYQSVIDMGQIPTIVTGGTIESTRLKINRSELAEILKDVISVMPVVTKEMTSQGKPHPDPYILGRRHSKEANNFGDDVVYTVFEDSVAGMHSAYDAGIDNIVVKPTKRSKSKFEDISLPPGVQKIDSWSDYSFQ